MSVLLEIEQRVEDEVKLLARLEEEEMLVGRAPAPTGIAIPSMSISGTHGKFVRFDEHWFYRDLNSTNGSWFNSNMILPSSYHLIKDGDLLNLSTVSLNLKFTFLEVQKPNSSRENPALFFFWQDQLKAVMPVPANGSAYDFSSMQAPVDLPKSFLSNNQFLIRTDGQTCIFESYRSQGSVLHNSQQLSPSSQIALSDRDSIVNGQLVVVFSDGYKVKREGRKRSETNTFIDPSYKYSKKLSMSSTFGQVAEEEEGDSLDIVRTEGIKRPMASSQKVNSQGDLIILSVGIFGIFLIFVLLLFFLLF